MTRHQLAITLVSVFFSGAFLVRSVWHRLRTGGWGFNGLSGGPRDPGWWGGVTFVLAIVSTPVALWLPAGESPSPLAGAVMAGLGAAFTFFAQSGMGRSWRIGVEATERTALVTTGVFALVRNPIFTGMLTFALGLVVLWPNVASVGAAASLLIAVELQVRFVEEPYLRSVHGQAWTAWAARVGRFVPVVGRVVLSNRRWRCEASPPCPPPSAGSGT